MRAEDLSDPACTRTEGLSDPQSAVAFPILDAWEGAGDSSAVRSVY